MFGNIGAQYHGVHSMIRCIVDEDRHLIGGFTARPIRCPAREPGGPAALSHLSNHTVHRPGNDPNGTTV